MCDVPGECFGDFITWFNTLCKLDATFCLGIARHEPEVRRSQLGQLVIQVDTFFDFLGLYSAFAGSGAFAPAPMG